MKPVLKKVSENTSWDLLMPLIRERIAAEQLVRIYPYGKSMLPMLCEGRDSVVLSKVQRIKKYDIILYQRENGQYILHRVVKVGKTYTCIGDNQFATEPGLRHDQMIAVVTAFYRGEKKYTTKSLSYQIYCRLWCFSRPIRHFWRRGCGWLRRHLWK